jgi:hypothetical protein
MAMGAREVAELVQHHVVTPRIEVDAGVLVNEIAQQRRQSLGNRQRLDLRQRRHFANGNVQLVPAIPG